MNLNNEMLPDSIMLYPENNFFKIKASEINGQGLFSTVDIESKCFLGPALIHKDMKLLFGGYVIPYNEAEFKNGWYRVIGTRYINHSKNPNIDLIYSDKIIYAYTLKDISANEEIFLNYSVHYQKDKIDIPEYCKILIK